MTISVPQDLARPGVAALAVPTRVRWTYVAPTLLTYWIISMLDKSNISLVIADPRFLGEMQPCRPNPSARLARRQHVHLL